MITAKKKIISFVLLIALIVTPLVGCTSNQSPIASFSYSPSAPTTADSISFTDSSTDADGTIASWNWNFGDGNTSTLQNPSHSFAATGTYTVTLTVTDDGGASDTDTATITVSSPPPLIGMWDAIEILVSEIIPPAAAYDRISAFMLSEPLQNGDVVSSASGEDYPINIYTWFIFIDDAPQALYAHATRYVFMDARTGDYDIVNETWPPDINNFSMWDTQNVGRGHLIEVWSILDSPLPISPATSTAPSGDYGDAPDGQLDLYYGIPGHFPTLYNTTNSHFGRPGGHTLNVGEETLGLNVSAEVDATDPSDPDGVPNLVDADSDERMYVIMDGSQARLAFTVSVSLGAPDVTRYANALIDFDQSGNWSTGTYGVEWVVVNLEVDVDPGTSETILTPLFDWGNRTLLPSEIWMRAALTRESIDEALFASVGGWDGSGQFTYGEIEDHFAFLTDNPLPPPGDGDGDGDGNGNGNGDGPPPPGPEEGPCGYDINYYVLIINCGDMYKHIAQGIPIAQSASSSVASAAQSQGYTSAGNLGPGSNSLSDIGTAIANLAAQAKCGDHVLIYICGHGSKKSSKKPEGGITIYNSSGRKTGEVLTPSALASMLGDFESCKDEDCGTPGCCHVSIVIESCYAGNFDIPGLNDQENMVVSGSSTNTPAQGIYPGGGVYTAGFVNGLQHSSADQSDPPNGVDPAEAHAAADTAVQNHPRSQAGNQQTWSEGNWCECKCPCSPGIDVEKWIWYDPLEMWATEVEVAPGALVTFRLEIENDGICRDIIDLEIVDVMDDCLEYNNDAILYYNGIPLGYRPPNNMQAVVGGTQLSWSLTEFEIGAVSPGDVIAIEYSAYAIEPGANLNWLYGSAHCSYNYDNIVTDEDSATVWVQEEEIVAEDVLHGYLEAHAYCECIPLPNCTYCDIEIYFAGEDISQQLGPYPVTYVALYVKGVLVFSDTTSTTFYSNTYTIWDAGCGATYNLQLIVRNSIGLEVIVNLSITTPLYCD